MKQFITFPDRKCSSSWCSTNWELVELCDTKLHISEFVLAGSHHLHQGTKRNGDFRCYLQATHPVPPARLCRMDRESYCCSFWVIFLRFSQFQCNLPGTPCVDQEGINGDLWRWCSASGTTQGLTDLDESLSGGQVLNTSCFYGQFKAESKVGRPSWLALWYCLCHSVWWCWLCAGSADYGRLGNQNPDFSY